MIRLLLLGLILTTTNLTASPWTLQVRGDKGKVKTYKPHAGDFHMPPEGTIKCLLAEEITKISKQLWGGHRVRTLICETGTNTVVQTVYCFIKEVPNTNTTLTIFAGKNTYIRINLFCPL